MTVDPTRIRKVRQAPKIKCARCETRLADPSKRIFSTHTRLHYCPDPDACARRKLRGRKKKAAA